MSGCLAAASVPHAPPEDARGDVTANKRCSEKTSVLAPTRLSTPPLVNAAALLRPLRTPGGPEPLDPPELVSRGFCPGGRGPGKLPPGSLASSRADSCCLGPQPFLGSRVRPASCVEGRLSFLCYSYRRPVPPVGVDALVCREA